MRETIGQTKEGLEFMSKLDALSEQARDHFRMVLLKLVECYSDENAHGVVLVSREGEDGMTFIAINANEMDAAEMLSRAGTVIMDINVEDMPDRGMLN